MLLIVKNKNSYAKLLVPFNEYGNQGKVMDGCWQFACPSKDSLLGSTTLLDSFAYTNPTNSPN